MEYDSGNVFTKIAAGNPLQNTLPSNAWIELIASNNYEYTSPGFYKLGSADFVKTMLLVDATTDFYGETTMIYS